MKKRKNLKQKIRKVFKDFKIQSGGFGLVKILPPSLRGGLNRRSNPNRRKRDCFGLCGALAMTRKKSVRKISKYFSSVVAGINSVAREEEQSIAQWFYKIDYFKNRQLERLTSGEAELFLTIKFSAFQLWKENELPQIKKRTIEFLDEKTRNFEYAIYNARKNLGKLNKNVEVFKNSKFSFTFNPLKLSQETSKLLQKKPQ